MMRILVWMYGPNWPRGGEVDIIEGANMAYDNLMSAHTSANCVLPSEGFSGTREYLDCADTTYGCNFVPPTTDMSSYGDDFNGVGGGVYALQWTDDAIKIWHFPRNGIPADIVAKQPDPSRWGLPQALFGSTSCDVPSHFNDMNIVLNIVSFGGRLWLLEQCLSLMGVLMRALGLLRHVRWQPVGLGCPMQHLRRHLCRLGSKQSRRADGTVLGSELYRRVQRSYCAHDDSHRPPDSADRHRAGKRHFVTQTVRGTISHTCCRDIRKHRRSHNQDRVLAVVGDFARGLYCS